MLPGPTDYEFLRLQQATSAHVEHRARYICCVICLVSDTGNAGTGPYSMQKRITQGKTSRLPWRYQAQLAGALGEQEHQASGWRVRTGCNTPESRTPRWGQLLDSQARLHLQFFALGEPHCKKTSSAGGVSAGQPAGQEQHLCTTQSPASDLASECLSMWTACRHPAC